MRKLYGIAVVIAGLVGGCASAPPAESRYSWELYLAPKVAPDTFKGQSVALLPAAGIEYEPTQEVYRETLAGLLYGALSKDHNGPTIVPIDAVQSVINRQALWGDVTLMYSEYRDSAVLRKDILSRLGQALNARYVLLPKLLHFQQEVFDRATIVGIAFLRTRQSTVDIHAQIWDTATGEVIWQGVGEGSEATEVVRGRPVSFTAVARNACESLASRMPWVKFEQK